MVSLVAGIVGLVTLGVRLVAGQVAKKTTATSSCGSRPYFKGKRQNEWYGCIGRFTENLSTDVKNQIIDLELKLSSKKNLKKKIIYICSAFVLVMLFIKAFKK